MRKHLTILLLCVLFLTGSALAADNDFTAKINTLKWVAYAPTHFNPERNQYPSDDSIEKDLQVLVKYGFNGIITYGSQLTLGHVPEIAKKVGFKGVIMGIWDLRDQAEVASAVFMADYADAYCIGNEGLYKRYTPQDLKEAFRYIKEKTGRPVTTTEEIFDYSKDYVMELGDWIFPNVHPFLSNVKTPSKGCHWIAQYYRQIKRHADELKKPVLFKEIGYPTRGDIAATSAHQKEFFQCMEKTDVKFAYFEAFDQPWKRWLPIEPHWGLFDKSRKPKKFMSGKLKGR